MPTVLKHATIYTGVSEIKDGYLRFEDKILAVGPMKNFQPTANDEFVIDLAGKIVVPGFIDIHSHGGYGLDMMDAEPGKIAQLAQKMAQEGITSYFATTMTQSPANIKKALIAARKAMELTPLIQGIHLEGPFICETFKGAQPLEHIINPSATLMAEWNELAGGQIKLVTYAPEVAGAREFEDYCLNNQIVLSIGHSNATRAELQQANATHITHFYNAQRPLKHREPGVVGHGFLEDNIYCELIVDGLHVKPEMIKLAYQIKGPERLEIITDAMRAKGLGDGESELGGQKVFAKAGQARLASGNLAGSVLQFDQAFANMIKFTGCSIGEAVQMSSVNQAREFGLTNKGTLEIGKDADLNILDQQLVLQSTYSNGELVN